MLLTRDNKTVKSLLQVRFFSFHLFTVCPLKEKKKKEKRFLWDKVLFALKNLKQSFLLWVWACPSASGFIIIPFKKKISFAGFYIYSCEKDQNAKTDTN